MPSLVVILEGYDNVYSNKIVYITSGHDIGLRGESFRRRPLCESSLLTETSLLPYNRPLVLGTSSPPVRSMAWRMARARALKADSAL